MPEHREGRATKTTSAVPTMAPRRSFPSLIAAILMAAALGTATNGCGRSSGTVPQRRADPRLPHGATGENRSAVEIRRATLGSGGTLASALDELKVDKATAALIARALAERADPRKLAPATGISTARDDAGRLLSVGLRVAPGRFLRVVPRSGGPSVEEVELPVERKLEVVAATVERSVGQALASHPHAVPLALAFSDIFQWDVDLFVDPRAGDEVRILYEVRRLGSPPRDLPPYGEGETEEGSFLGLGPVLAASYHGREVSVEAFRVPDVSGVAQYYDGDGRPLRKAFLKSPLNYRRISSGYSWSRRNPITRKVAPHLAVDFAAARGTPVVAAADGRVVSAGWDGPLGKAVRLRHGNGYVTIYGHLSGFARGIRKGAKVRQGRVIGYVGATGRATGPHLHYAMRLHGRPIHPLRFRNPPVHPLPPELIPRLEAARARWGPVLRSGALTAAGPAPDPSVIR